MRKKVTAIEARRRIKLWRTRVRPLLFNRGAAQQKMNDVQKPVTQKNHKYFLESTYNTLRLPVIPNVTKGIWNMDKTPSVKGCQHCIASKLLRCILPAPTKNRTMNVMRPS